MIAINLIDTTANIQRLYKQQGKRLLLIAVSKLDDDSHLAPIQDFTLVQRIPMHKAYIDVYERKER